MLLLRLLSTEVVFLVPSPSHIRLLLVAPLHRLVTLDRIMQICNGINSYSDIIESIGGDIHSLGRERVAAKWIASTKYGSLLEC